MRQVESTFDAGQRRVLEKVATGQPLRTVLEAIVHLIEEQGPDLVCACMLFDEEQRRLRDGAAVRLPRELVAAFDGLLVGPEVGSCGTAAHCKKCVIVEDIATHPSWHAYRELVLPHGLRACWSTPIFSAEQALLGTFAIYYREPRGPTQQELNWIEAAAHLAALAIERDRNEQALRRSEARAHALARLYAVSSSVNEAIARSVEPAKLYDLACRIAVEKGFAQLAWIGVYKEASDRIEPLARFGNDAGYVDAITLGLHDPRLNQGPAARALRSGRVALSNDIAKDPNFFWKEDALSRGLRACAVFPLRRHDRTLALFVIYGEQVGFFGDEELRVLSALADDISFAVQSFENESRRSDAEESLRRNAERLRVLHTLGEALRTNPDPEQTLPIALRVLGQHLHASRCAYAEVDADGERFTVLHCYTDHTHSVVGQYRISEFLGPEDAAALRAGRGAIASDVRLSYTPEQVAKYEQAGIAAFVCCSLVKQGRLRAMVAVQQTTPRAWTPEEVELVNLFVERCFSATEQNAAEAALRQREALLRIAGRVARLGGFGLEIPSLLLTWSDEVCAIHEVPIGTAPTSEEALAFFLPEFRDSVSAKFEACISRGVPFDAEAQILTAAGHKVWVRVTGQAERNSTGAIVRVQGALQDISDRRRLEAQFLQAQKMEAVGQLAGGVAHDFNNLLSVIIGTAALMLEDLRPNDPTRADVEQINKAAMRAAELTRQLLAFSRHQILAPRVVDLSHTVFGLQKMLRRLLGDDMVLTIQNEPVLGRVLVDPGQIEQVIMNLVVNARDAMPSGGTIGIEVSNCDLTSAEAASVAGVSLGRYVTLAVTDSGMGMDAATCSRVFEPFFTTKEKSKGTGLGLSTAYGIVTQSGGRITVESQLGVGTTFKVYLPRVDAAADEDEVTPAKTKGRGSETVLLVEDEEQVRAVARTILRRGGYNVLEAQNAGEAFLTVEKYEGKIHLLLTDFMMPRMNGRELALRIAPMRPDMKVLYVSGYAEDTIVHDGVLQAGIAFLAKPITPESLLTKVRSVLDTP